MDLYAASASQALRWLRAVMLAGVTLLVGTVAHASAGGLLPSAWAMTALFAGGVLISAACLGRSASMPLLIAMVAGGQTFIHVALTVLAGHADEPAQPIVWTFDGLAASGSALAADLASHVPMMTAHLVASVGVALWLAVGERALWSLLFAAAVIVLRPMLRALLALRARIVVPRCTVLVPGFSPEPPAQLAVLARCVVRRGPPLILAA